MSVPVKDIKVTYPLILWMQNCQLIDLRPKVNFVLSDRWTLYNDLDFLFPFRKGRDYSSFTYCWLTSNTKGSGTSQDCWRHYLCWYIYTSNGLGEQFGDTSLYIFPIIIADVEQNGTGALQGPDQTVRYGLVKELAYNRKLPEIVCGPEQQAWNVRTQHCRIWNQVPQATLMTALSLDIALVENLACTDGDI